MNYIKVNIRLGIKGSLTEEDMWISDVFKDALIAYGYDSFADTKDGFEAYCPQNCFSSEDLKTIVAEEFAFIEGLDVQWESEQIEQKDWNAEWEKNYPSVRFGDFCLVRPPFNPCESDVKYDIVIEPKMSFGTAHHQTTSLIIEMLSHENLEGKRLMDMGCGTGVLAILASKMGATKCVGIDNDTWAAENAKENVARNQVSVDIFLGDAGLLKQEEEYDVFIANINRNILLDNMEIYSKSIVKGGSLLLSGFYKADIPILESKCKACGLVLQESKTKDDWAVMQLRKVK